MRFVVRCLLHGAWVSALLNLLYVIFLAYTAKRGLERAGIGAIALSLKGLVASWVITALLVALLIYAVRRFLEL